MTTPTEIICPTCGEATPPGRRCRKCAADLPDSSPDAAQPGREAEGLRVTLVSSPGGEGNGRRDVISGDPLLDRLRAPHHYHLEVVDAAGKAPSKTLPVPGTGGVTLARWTITRLDARAILSAFFYVNSAGHDLDMWIHYDLETCQSLGMSQSDEHDPDPARHLRD